MKRDLQPREECPGWPEEPSPVPSPLLSASSLPGEAASAELKLTPPVCVSDIVALGVHQALLGAGLAPGRDLGIVGFDGTPTARIFGLTTVEQPVARIVTHLLDQLDLLLGDDRPPPTPALLPPVLRIDASSRRR